MRKKKITVIEYYAQKGLLDDSKSNFTSEERCKVGLRLGEDFYKAKLEGVTAIDYSKVRVDTSIKSEADYVLDARDRYNKAIRSIPIDFYKVVREVCCYDHPIKGVGATKQQRLYDRYTKICDLRRGLDYLIRFYFCIGLKTF